MREIHTIKVDRYEPTEKKNIVRHVGMISPQEAFDALEKHLKEANMLPDEYFNFSSWAHNDVKELPNYFRASCDVHWGGSEGIYLDIDLLYRDENQQLQYFHLATGKTLGESGDDFLKMSRIAAECSMMLNGRGEVVRFSEEPVKDSVEVLKGDYFAVEKAIKEAYSSDDVELASHFATCKAPDMTIEDVVRLYSDLKQEIDGDQVFEFKDETGEVKALWSLDEPFYSKTEIANLFSKYVGSDNKDYLMAFIEQEVPFRLRELKHISVIDDTIDALIAAVKENTDVMFDYDRFDAFLMEKLQELLGIDKEWVACLRGEISNLRKELNGAIEFDPKRVAGIEKRLGLLEGQLEAELNPIIPTPAFEDATFIDDKEKMKDFVNLSKEEFLQSYSYLTEEEYDNTLKLVQANLFIFDDEIMINDDFDGVNGYLWAVDALVDRLPSSEHMENINFYADYNVKTGDIKLIASYDTPSEDGEVNKVYAVPLSNSEKKLLVSKFNEYCQRIEGKDCLEFLNSELSSEKRQSDKPSLDSQMTAAVSSKNKETHNVSKLKVQER